MYIAGSDPPKKFEGEFPKDHRDTGMECPGEWTLADFSPGGGNRVTLQQKLAV